MKSIVLLQLMKEKGAKTPTVDCQPTRSTTVILYCPIHKGYS